MSELTTDFAFSFQFAGSFFRLDDFLGHLQGYITASRQALSVTGRLLVINGIGLNAGSQGFPHMEASIAATAYLVPPGQGTFNGATPQAPPAASSANQAASTTAPAPSPVAPATVKP